MPSLSLPQRARMAWPLFKLAGRYLPSKDVWESVEADVPFEAFGKGSLHEFDWYWGGVSQVKVTDVADIGKWLAGCEGVDDKALFRQDDFWQHPLTFEQLRRGDCEDHALWTWRKLGEIGVHTEFVCGRYRPAPDEEHHHAWVIFHDASGSYLFDPVIKDPKLALRPLTEAKGAYIPHLSVDERFQRKIYGGHIDWLTLFQGTRRSTYSELQCARILETIRTLERRISERFPASGLSRICAELGLLTSKTEATIERLRRPIWVLRIGAVLGVLAIIAVASGLAVFGWNGKFSVPSLAELLIASEAAVNELILLAAAVFFMVSLEKRFKRRAALKALHRLRSIVHVVDMHQLTKDPGYTAVTPTASSPERDLSRSEMGRYLDYCSELFSLTSKTAALYAQHLSDPVVLDAVSDIETLAASLSNKVWQKIMILDIAHAN
jgi:hypothetical protein